MTLYETPPFFEGLYQETVHATVLCIQSTLAEQVIEAAYNDKRETLRRWLPGRVILNRLALSSAPRRGCLRSCLA
jgi:hypothetical protein